MRKNYFYSQVNKNECKGWSSMKKLNEMQIGKRLTTAFRITTMITSIAAIAAIIVLYVISNRYTYALRYFGFPQGDIGRSMIYFTDTRSDLRAIIGYDMQNEIDDLLSQYNEDKEGFISSWEAVEDTLTTAAAKSTYQSINDKLPDYWSLNEEIIALGKNVSDQSSRDQAQSKAMNEIAPAYEELNNLMYDILNTMTNSGDSLDTNLNIATYILIAVAILILIVSFIISTRLSRFIATGIAEPVTALEHRLVALEQGDLTTAFPEIASDDEVSKMAKVAADMSNSLKLIIEDIDYCLAEMANGNYTVTSKYPDKYVGEYAGIIAALRQMSHQMNDTLRQINDASNQVSAGSNNLAQAAQSLAEGATDQSASVQELQATIANIAEGVAKTSENTVASYQQASKYADEADHSRSEMESMMNAMQRINEASQNIGNIISEIEDIASQTNLLSLNASIEAARAGEAGKGFAVVADQIRKLAEQSTQSAVDTRQLIEGSLAEVDAGNKAAQRAFKSIESIISGIKSIAQSSQELSEISKEQSSSMLQVEQGINQISEVVQSNSATAEETSATSQELSAQATTLNDSISQFQLK